MTSLRDIGNSIGVGLGTTSTALVLFYFAVRLRSPIIAPRCAGRSPDTIFNPKVKRKDRGCCSNKEQRKLKTDEVDENEEDCDELNERQAHPQNRGGAMLGWICWTMSLSYEQMFKGVLGTGTRKNGLEGKMLNVNLDNIVLLRFHGKVFNYYIIFLFIIMMVGQSLH